MEFVYTQEDLERLVVADIVQRGYQWNGKCVWYRVRDSITRGWVIELRIGTDLALVQEKVCGNPM